MEISNGLLDELLIFDNCTGEFDKDYDYDFRCVFGDYELTCKIIEMRAYNLDFKLVLNTEE